MLITAILLALLPSGNTALAEILRSRTCDESFPLATPLPQGGTSPRDKDGRRLRDRRLVAIRRDDMGQYYESGEYYAPLCPDGRHIDIRKLYRCVGGSCWNECINQCTFECTWNTIDLGCTPEGGDYSPRPTRKPTPHPTHHPTGPPKETEQPVLLSLGYLPETYRMNNEVRAAISRYIRGMLEDELEKLGAGIELLGVTSFGRLPGKPHSLPLKITVQTPSDQSDFALFNVIQTMKDATQEIVTNLKKLDGAGGEDFTNISLSIGTYDFADTLFGETNYPTTSPTPRPTQKPIFPLRETENPLLLSLEYLPESYRMNNQIRSAIVRYIRGVLEDDLDELRLGIQLREVSSPGILPGKPHSLPLNIKLTAPSDVSDFALSYTIQAMKDATEEIETNLKKLAEADGEAFKSVSLLVGTYDFDEIAEFMEETKHPVILNFDNMPAGYNLSPADKSSILRFVKELLDNNLADPFKLVGVADASSGRKQRLLSSSQQHSRRLDTVSLPVRVTVKGPPEDSESASFYVMKVLEDHEQDLLTYAKSLDWDAFKDANLSTKSYDPNDITLPTTELEHTAHPVTLNFDNMPDGYNLSPADRSSILRFVKELLEDNLDDSFQLVEVADASSSTSRGLSASPLQFSRRLDALSLPLSITIKGPAEQSDLALSNVMEVLEDHQKDLLEFAQSLDWEAFKDANLSTASYDPNAITLPLEHTVHPVTLNFDNMPDGYTLSPADRSSVLRFVKELLNNNLDDPFQLVKVADASSGHSRGLSAASLHLSRRLDTLSLPLSITVKGPADQPDLALSNVMKVLEEQKEDLMNFLKSLDWEAFKDGIVSIEIYNFSDPQPMDTIIMEDTTTKIPWWVWLIVALVMFLCCICFCCSYFIRRQRLSRGADKNDSVQQGQQVNLFMQNRTQPSRPRQESQPPLEYERTKKSQLPIRSITVNPSDQSRRTTRTTRTARTHKTRSACASHSLNPAPILADPTPEIAIAVAPVREPDLETEESTDISNFVHLPALTLDGASAASGLPGGYDPPEERALVPYNPNPQARDPTFYSPNSQGRDPTFYDDRTINPKPAEARDPTFYDPNPLARDPTFYADRTVNHKQVEARDPNIYSVIAPGRDPTFDAINFNSDQVEPEGDKVCRKKSMFVNDVLMDKVRRERGVEAEKKLPAKKVRSKRRSKHKKSMGDKYLKIATQQLDTEPSVGAESQRYSGPSDDGIEDQDYYHSDKGLSEPDGLSYDELAAATKRKSKKKSRTSKKKSSSKSETIRDRVLDTFDIETLHPNDSGYDSLHIHTHSFPPEMEEQQHQKGNASTKKGEKLNSISSDYTRDVVGDSFFIMGSDEVDTGRKCLGSYSIN